MSVRIFRNLIYSFRVYFSKLLSVVILELHEKAQFCETFSFLRVLVVPVFFCFYKEISVIKTYILADEYLSSKIAFIVSHSLFFRTLFYMKILFFLKYFWSNLVLNMIYIFEII